jgi:hypothetical protein
MRNYYLINFDKFLPPKGRSEQARSTAGGGQYFNSNGED